MVSYLPSSEFELVNLKKLTLSSAPIHFLPKGICNSVVLEALILRDTQITSLPKELCKFNNLQGLEKWSWNVRFESSVFDVIKNLPRLKSLRVGGPPDILNHVPAVSGLRQLELDIVQQSSANEESMELEVFNTNSWKQSSTLESLRIYGRDNKKFGNILTGLPTTLQELYLRDFKSEFFDALANDTLPPNLRALDVVDCGLASYSDQERLYCMRNLAQNYMQLGHIRISEYGHYTDTSALPFDVSCLLRFNKCGRFLVEGDMNMRATKPVPMSVWPIVLARVGRAARGDSKGMEGLVRRMEPSVLFRLLQGAAFLGSGSIASKTLNRKKRKAESSVQHRANDSGNTKSDLSFKHYLAVSSRISAYD